ncbi:hypothetical protein L3Q82_000596 [Scortum barcoo]|uniref:Uncharacterized protein n=1 Tax=Scortum barcoo TaxID=214431 RepID=A0ACB8WF38_9TELE|nr:hypothetical protein L3Q82_000596 [Scortum barcoo]
MFSLLTHDDCSAIHPSCLIVKFADDTAVVGRIANNDESDYRQEVEHLEGWCRQNNLCINVKKTKEMIVDFRRGRHLPSPLYIGGTAVEVVSSFQTLDPPELNLPRRLTLKSYHQHSALITMSTDISLPRKAQRNYPPRPFITRIHHYQTKKRILKLPREAGSLSFRGSDIHIYLDYSVEIVKKRAAYFTVKSQLRNAGLAYRMLFPAKLQVANRNDNTITCLFLNGNGNESMSPVEQKYIAAGNGIPKCSKCSREKPETARPLERKGKERKGNKRNKSHWMQVGHPRQDTIWSTFETRA